MVKNKEDKSIKGTSGSGTQKPAKGNDSKNLLSQFWSLASFNEDERVNSVLNILKELEASENKEESVGYAIKRLIKGIGSSRKKARLGFSTALVHILDDCQEHVDIKDVYKSIDEHLSTKGSSTGNEEKEANFGKVFALISILQHITKTPKLIKIEISTLKAVYEDLLTLMNKKIYLKELVAVAVCQSFEKISYEDLKSFQEIFLEKVAHGLERTTASDILIAQALINSYKDEDFQQELTSKWGSADILSSENLKKLYSTLMNTTEISHPKVHSIWKLVLEKAKTDEEYLKTFWKVIVEDALLKSTHERKYLAVQLLLKLSSSVTVDCVEELFSPAMMKCIINSCNSKENFLYKAARDMLGRLPEELAQNADSQVIPTVLKHFVGSNGNIMFDSMTNTKTVENMTLKLTDYKAHFTWLRGSFVNDQSQLSGKDAASKRIWVLNQMTLLAKACKKANQETIVVDVACFLFLHGFFNVLKKSKKELLLNQSFPSDMKVTEKVHNISQQRFQTVLTELTCWSKNIEGQTKKFNDGVAEDGDLFTMKILLFAERLLQFPKNVILIETWLPETRELFDEELTKLKEEEGGKETSVSSSKGMQLLRHHATLHLFKEQEEGRTVLQDVQECCRKAGGKKRKASKEPDWSEVLLEILIGFLAQPSNVMRHVVEQVFRSICPHLTMEGFRSLTKILEAKKSQDLQENESEDEEESGEEDEDEDGGDEEMDNENDENGQEDSDENESESDESESEGGSEGEEIDEEFQRKIKKALGKHAAKTNGDIDESKKDAESDSDSEEEQEDLDMDTADPNHLKALDSALADIFRQRKEKADDKKDKQAEREAMHHLKLRVLDLFVIFLKEQPTNGKIIYLVKPLLALIHASQNRPELSTVYDKSVNIYRTKLCQHKCHAYKDVDTEELHNIMSEILIMAKKSGSAPIFVEQVSQGLIFLIKLLRSNVDAKGPSPLKTRSQRKRKPDAAPKVSATRMKSSDEAKVVELYKGALDHFMQKKSSPLQAKMFMELINRYPNIAWKLGFDLLQYLNTACNNYRKVKSAEMLKALFAHKIDEEKEYIEKISEAVLENLIKVFESTKEAGFPLKPRQLSEIIRLIDSFKKLMHHHPKVIVDWTKMMSSLKDILDSPIASKCNSLMQVIKTRV
ncbi:myb-binding protein 1A-like protein [Clytia hemisphaerica]|eukprot:TCONS_00032763-protein